jgi:hypothetical protein
MFAWHFLLILFLIALNAFSSVWVCRRDFAAAVSIIIEEAMLLPILSNPGSKSSTRDRLIAATQLGITIVNLTLGAVVRTSSEAADSGSTKPPSANLQRLGSLAALPY